MAGIFDNKIVIAFDGPDGSGKTSAIQHIKKELENLHANPMFQLPRPIKVYSEHALKSSIQGQAFYELMEGGHLSDDLIGVGALFNWGYHVQNVIPAILDQYDVVLIDRFRPSFLAYQIFADKHVFIEDIFERFLHREKELGVTPDYFYLRSSVERSDGLLRAREKASGEQLSYHETKPASYKRDLLRGFDEFFFTDRYNFAKKSTIIDLDKEENGTQPNLEDFHELVFEKFLNEYVDQLCSNVRASFRESHAKNYKNTFTRRLITPDRKSVV